MTASPTSAAAPEELRRVRKQLAVARPQPPPGPAAVVPVARVAVDVPLAHLDRPFDYLVPEPLADAAVPGARVRVRFAGRRVAGYVLERTATSDHPGRLGRIERVVSSEVVLRRDVAALCRAVADHYAGTFADVVRLAVPPRHGRVEQAAVAAAEPLPLLEVDASPWQLYPGGAALLERLGRGAAPRAAWTTLGGEDWVGPLAQAVLATAHAGRGSLVCVPDVRDVARADAELGRVLGGGHHVVLTSELGPQARYRAFLAVARGHVRVVLGTRGAAFAPVHDLGLVAIWDDGDDLHCEPRAPYPHAREVLARRAQDAGAGMVIAGYARSLETQALVEAGWCADLSALAAVRRSHGARVTVTGASCSGAGHDPGGHGRLPHEALRALRAGLATGPVLVSVARAGYRVALACQDCREPARCGRCGGPLGQPSAGADPSCRWCGLSAPAWACAHCGGRRLRAPVVGERRTAEELGRTFPGHRVRTSSAQGSVDSVGDLPDIVVATPGAEPVAVDGYAAVLILDTGLALARADMRAGEESLRRWSNVTGLVRPAGRGGRVAVVGDSGSPVLQSLLRADPAGFAARELRARRAARLPPSVRLATITGPVEEVVGLPEGDWPQPADVLGPVSLDDERARLVVRVPRHRGAALARALQVMQAARSSHKLATLRVQLDPLDIG